MTQQYIILSCLWYCIHLVQWYIPCIAYGVKQNKTHRRHWRVSVHFLQWYFSRLTVCTYGANQNKQGVIIFTHPSCLLILIQHFPFAKTQSIKVFAAAITATSGGVIAIYNDFFARFLMKSWVMERNMPALIAHQKRNRKWTLAPQWLHVILGLEGFFQKAVFNSKN